MENSSKINDDRKKTSVMISKAYTNSIKSAALNIQDISGKKLDMITLVSELNSQLDKIIDGDTREIEVLLFTQAKTLSAIFTCMIERIANSSSLHEVQIFSDISLRAQNQCRQTLAVLAELKHPRRTTFIKQQNNAMNQQVNNQLHDSKNPILTNELFEGKHDPLDIQASITPVTANSNMATLEEINRRKNSAGEKYQQNERL